MMKAHGSLSVGLGLSPLPQNLCNHSAFSPTPRQSKRRRTATRATSFEEVADGRFLFYEDSSGRMAIAVNRGDASEVLDLRVGDVVELEPAP